MASNRQLERNLVVYPLYTTVIITPVMLPIIVLFWQDNGMDLFEVFLLQALYAVAVVVLEVPTGMVADRLGKRIGLMAGTWAIAIGSVGYALGTGFGSFLAAEIALAVGSALVSGADTSLLYDTLHALGRQDEYTRREGRARALQMAGFAICNLAGGLIGSYDYRVAMWASATGPIVALLVAPMLVEVQAQAAPASMGEAWRGYRDLMGQTLRFVRRHALVRWQMGLLAIISGSSMWLLWLFQPYMKLTGWPVWSFGIAFAAFNLFAAFVSERAAAVEARFGQRGTLLLLIGLQTLPPLLMGLFVHPAAVLLIFGQQSVRALARPIIAERLLRYTWADKRSTILSVAALAGRLFFAVTAPVMGWVGESVNLVAVLLLQGGTLVVLFAAMWWLYLRIPAKYFQVKSTVTDRQ